MESSEKIIDKIFWSSLIFGSIIMIIGIFTITWHEMGTVDARLILCSGIGIILGAFGSTAVVKYKGLTITGVAAISLVLLYTISNITGSKATFGRITGDVKGTQIEVEGDEQFLGALRGRNYDFVVIGDKINRPVFDVYIYFPPNEDGKGEQEIQFRGINKKFLVHFLGSGQNIEWDFNNGPYLKSLVETKTGEVMREFDPNKPETLLGQNSVIENRLSFVSLALAQNLPRSIEKIFIDLGSGFASIRRMARRELALQGPKNVKRMMIELREKGSAYRIRLGIIAALTEMLRNDKNKAKEISNNLSDGDIKILVEAIDDNDPTIRAYASEFLKKLGDPRVIETTLSLAKSSRYNLQTINLSSAVINKGTYRKVSAETVKGAEKELRVLQNSTTHLQLHAIPTPKRVRPGQKTEISVNVRDEKGRVVQGAEVTVSSGGGKFLKNSAIKYDPKSRLHGPYNVIGKTGSNGEFKTWWVCNPCASGYGLVVNASKKGYLESQSRFKIDIQ